MTEFPQKSNLGAKPFEWVLGRIIPQLSKAAKEMILESFNFYIAHFATGWKSPRGLLLPHIRTINNVCRNRLPSSYNRSGNYSIMAEKWLNRLQESPSMKQRAGTICPRHYVQKMHDLWQCVVPLAGAIP